MSEERITAWVTKYALTDGILEVDGRVNHGISSRMLSYGRSATAHGNDWHRSLEAAMARAEEMRTARLASIAKQAKRLESMTFKVIKG